MDVAQTGNLIEAGLWGLIALVLAVVAWRTGRTRRGELVWLSVAFALFGVSDLLEMRSGAWWRPPWLLALKACCVAAIVYGLWRAARRQRDTIEA